MGATTGTDLSASCVLRFIWALCTWRATWREVSSEVSSDFLASYSLCLAAPPRCPVGHQRHTCTPNKHNNPPTPPTSTLDTPRHAATIQEHCTLPESHKAKYTKQMLLVGVVVVVLLLLPQTGRPAAAILQAKGKCTAAQEYRKDRKEISDRGQTKSSSCFTCLWRL